MGETGKLPSLDCIPDFEGRSGRSTGKGGRIGAGEGARGKSHGQSGEEEARISRGQFGRRSLRSVSKFVGGLRKSAPEVVLNRVAKVVLGFSI